jgi:hypothetical protein
MRLYCNGCVAFEATQLWMEYGLLRLLEPHRWLHQTVAQSLVEALACLSENFARKLIVVDGA